MEFSWNRRIRRPQTLFWEIWMETDRSALRIWYCCGGI